MHLMINGIPKTTTKSRKTILNKLKPAKSNNKIISTNLIAASISAFFCAFEYTNESRQS
jgi:hypothetical protein